MAKSAPVQLAHFGEAHLAEVLAIEQSVQNAAWSETAFRNEIGNPRGIFLVALRQGKVVGFGDCWLIVDEAHIVSMAVHKDHQRQGVARRLMIELLLRAKEMGALCSTLEVRESNAAALALYEGLGYVRCGYRKNYYPDNHEAAVIMWLHHLETWEAAT